MMVTKVNESMIEFEGQSYDTLSDAVNSSSLQVGQTITVAERTSGYGGSGTWEVVPITGVTPNTYTVVEVVSDNTLALVLQVGSSIDPKTAGALGDGVNDDSGAFIASAELAVDIVGDKESNYLITQPVPLQSDTVVDLKGATVTWNGVAPVEDITGRDRGIFEVKGYVGATIDSVSQSAWDSNTDRFPITIGSAVPSFKYVKMTAGSLPDAHLSYLIKPTLDQDATNRIRADYVLGYDLVSPTFVYTEVELKERVNIKNFTIVDLTNSADDDEDISGIVLQYAADCHVLNVHAVGTNNPVVFGYYTTDCTVGKGHIDTPTKATGGKGYYVQWNNSLRALSFRLTGELCRHISDFTTSAFSSVIECGGTNTKSGEFTTHGAYEHDLLYDRTRGYLSFANSGEAFGQSAKNITVIKHVGSNIRARTNIENMHLIDCKANYVNLNAVDLTVENLQIFDSADGVGKLQINNWSRQLGKTFTINRPSVIRDSKIVSDDDVYLFESTMSTDEILLDNCAIALRSQDFKGGHVTMRDCALTSKDSGIISTTAIRKLHLIGCTAVNVGFRCDDRSASLDFMIDGGTWSGNNLSNQMISNRDSSGVAGNRWVMSNAKVNWEGTDTIESGASFTNTAWDILMSGNDFRGGNIQHRSTQFPYRSVNNVFYSGVTYLSGTAGATRIVDNNIDL